MYSAGNLNKLVSRCVNRKRSFASFENSKTVKREFANKASPDIVAMYGGEVCSRKINFVYCVIVAKISASC